MTTQPAPGPTSVIGGVDTHKHTHYAAAVDDQGRLLSHQEFPANDRGYRALLAWLSAQGVVTAIGVESTGSFGATLSRFLTGEGIRVIEVNRPNRLARRMDGKSDRLDAEQIARAVLGQTSTATPKAKSGIVEVIRTLRVTRTSAVKARTATFNTMWGVMISAPSPLRDELVTLTMRTLVNRCLRLRPESDDLLGLATDPDRLLAAGVRTALRDLARRWKQLDEEVKVLNRHIAALVKAAAPDLVELHGVGVEIAGQFLVTAGDNAERIRSEAAFAKLCGVAPQLASSGRTSGRHRLSRGGDRAANSALYIVTIVRLRHHQPTRDYVERRTAEGLSKREIIRCQALHRPRDLRQPAPASRGHTIDETASFNGLTNIGASNASTTPWPPSGPTGASSAPTTNEPPLLRPGWSTTTLSAATAPSEADHPSAGGYQPDGRIHLAPLRQMATPPRAHAVPPAHPVGAAHGAVQGRLDPGILTDPHLTAKYTSTGIPGAFDLLRSRP